MPVRAKISAGKVEQVLNTTGIVHQNMYFKGSILTNFNSNGQFSSTPNIYFRSGQGRNFPHINTGHTIKPHYSQKQVFPIKLFSLKQFIIA